MFSVIYITYGTVALQGIIASRLYYPISFPFIDPEVHHHVHKFPPFDLGSFQSTPLYPVLLKLILTSAPINIKISFSFDTGIYSAFRV
jgi:hypothetical protein